MAQVDNTPPRRVRATTRTATIEVDKDLRRAYKLAAVEMDTTMRALTEEALRAYLPQIEKLKAAQR